jgi:hypothetical protein
MASPISVRLLSSVAVVGRDNEPIYLRGDLCNTTAATNLDKLAIREDPSSFDADESSVQDVSVIDADAPPTPCEPVSETIAQIRPLTTENEEIKADNSKDDDDDDPFGFFTQTSHSMSLTNQLVLHASLDRFEEMTASTNNGGVRWRTPGSSGGSNAMWMGRLCEVEERWNVYGEFGLGFVKRSVCCMVFICLLFHLSSCLIM